MSVIAPDAVGVIVKVVAVEVPFHVKVTGTSPVEPTPLGVNVIVP